MKRWTSLLLLLALSACVHDSRPAGPSARPLPEGLDSSLENEMKASAMPISDETVGHSAHAIKQLSEKVPSFEMIFDSGDNATATDTGAPSHLDYEGRRLLREIHEFCEVKQDDNKKEATRIGEAVTRIKSSRLTGDKCPLLAEETSKKITMITHEAPDGFQAGHIHLTENRKMTVKASYLVKKMKLIALEFTLDGMISFDNFKPLENGDSSGVVYTDATISGHYTSASGDKIPMDGKLRRLKRKDQTPEVDILLRIRFPEGTLVLGKIERKDSRRSYVNGALVPDAEIQDRFGIGLLE